MNSNKIQIELATKRRAIINKMREATKDVDPAFLMLILGDSFCKCLNDFEDIVGDAETSNNIKSLKEDLVTLLNKMYSAIVENEINKRKSN